MLPRRDEGLIAQIAPRPPPSSTGLPIQHTAARLRTDGIVLAALALGWTALWLLTVPVGNFPLNDDWVYALAVRSVIETGRYTLPSPATADVIAQIYWGALFCLPAGFSFTALHLSTFVAGTAGVLTLFLLLRELGADQRVAAIGAATLAVNPLYLALSTSFMTDVPFTATVTASLFLYVRGIKRDSTAAVLGAILVAFGAILVRQFALMLLLGFAVSHVARRGFGPRALLWAVLPLLAGAALHVGYERWVITTGRTPLVFSPVSSLLPRNPVVFAQMALHMTLRILPYLGLFLMPVAALLLFGRHARSARPAPRHLLLGTLLVGGALLLMMLAKELRLPMIGNILLPSGIGALTLTDTYLAARNLPTVPIVLRWAWPVLTVASAFVTGLLLVVVGAALLRVAAAAWRARSLRPAAMALLLLTIVGAYAAGMFVLGYQSFWFDRYLLLFLPPLLALLVLARPGWAPRSVLAPCIVLALYAVFAVGGTHDYLAWNRARWRALGALEAQGVRPQQIDGGYEYNGWYLFNPKYQATPGKSYWWVVDNEYMISSGPMPGYAPVGHFPYHRWLSLGTEQVLALRREY